MTRPGSHGLDLALWESRAVVGALEGVTALLLSSASLASLALPVLPRGCRVHAALAPQFWGAGQGTVSLGIFPQNDKGGTILSATPGPSIHTP